MTDPIHPSNPLPADKKRLSRVRGAHKGAFTKLEKKVDDFLTTVIATAIQLVGADALLKKRLKTRSRSSIGTTLRCIYFSNYDDQLSRHGAFDTVPPQRQFVCCTFISTD